MSAGVRLFVGVPVSMATLRALDETGERLRRVAAEQKIRVRWVDPATYHVTLKFLGWTREEAVAAIRDRVRERLADVRAFSFTTGGLGAFPTTARGRVLWAGIERGGEQLASLAAAVEETLVPLGYEAEKRDFHPHVTLGRVKVPANVQALIDEGREVVFGDSLVDRVVLFQSVTSPSGAEYRVRAEWPLKAAT